jgi:hypothetical protein
VELQEQISNYFNSLTEAKRADIESLNNMILQLMPACKLWYLDGKDEKGKVVSNPSVGYGQRMINYADGKAREFYQVGLSANTAGISVYIMGIKDKNYLPGTYAKTIGKANVTGYCIKFKSLKDINVDVLETAIRDGVKQTS